MWERRREVVREEEEARCVGSGGGIICEKREACSHLTRTRLQRRERTACTSTTEKAAGMGLSVKLGARQSCRSKRHTSQHIQKGVHTLTWAERVPPASGRTRARWLVIFSSVLTTGLRFLW